MKCAICKAPLTVRGYSTKNGRRSPVYHPCPRINDVTAHPAADRRYDVGAGRLTIIRPKLKIARDAKAVRS